jgi:hypothetical protein
MSKNRRYKDDDFEFEDENAFRDAVNLKTKVERMKERRSQRDKRNTLWDVSVGKNDQDDNE